MRLTFSALSLTSAVVCSRALSISAASSGKTRRAAASSSSPVSNSFWLARRCASLMAAGSLASACSGLALSATSANARRKPVCAAASSTGARLKLSPAAAAGAACWCCTNARLLCASASMQVWVCAVTVKLGADFNSAPTLAVGSMRAARLSSVCDTCLRSERASATWPCSCDTAPADACSRVTDWAIARMAGSSVNCANASRRAATDAQCRAASATASNPPASAAALSPAALSASNGWAESVCASALAWSSAARIGATAISSRLSDKPF